MKNLKIGVLLYAFAFILLFISPIVSAKDSTRVNRFGFGGTPILAYDPDLGLRYGAVVNVFDYGDNVKYPNYDQYLKIKAFNSTKGTSNLTAILESDRIIPYSTLVVEASIIKDTKLDFYGFNGADANLNKEFINPESENYRNKFYYSHQRFLMRLRANWHKPIWESDWKIMLGISWLDYRIDDINYEKLNAPDGSNGNTAEQTSLYSQYIDWGVIDSKEGQGGQTTNFLAGIEYDTRNSKINCTNGFWFETYLVNSITPSSGKNFIKHVLSVRQYFEFERSKSVFMWRLSSQQKLAGDIPFYLLPIYYDTRQNQDGFGGAYTLRGVYRNRIAAEGYVLGNIEYRKNVLSTRFLKLNWDLELSLFADGVFVSQEYPIDYSQISSAQIEQEFRSGLNQQPVFTIGIGTYIIYNKNNITSINFGWSPDERFGNKGIYIGSAFLF